MKIQPDDDEDRERLEEESTVKVTIPERLRLKMHSVKVLSGKTLSDQATEALEAYFSDGDGDEDS